MLALVGNLRACVVSFAGVVGVKHTVEVTAETLFEAVVLGVKAIRVQSGEDRQR
jgi:hypothetical protein